MACCDDCCGEGGFFVGEDCAQIEDEAIVFDARDYWRPGGGFAKAGFEGGWRIIAAMRSKSSALVAAGRGLNRRRLRRSPDAFRLRRLRVCECVAKFGGESFCALGDFVRRRANHAQCGNFVERAAKVCVERDFESGDRELVHAQRAEERIAADAFDEFAFAGDDAGLRAAEQFVAAEADDVDAGVAAGARDRLIDSAGGEIGEAAGAEILVDGNVQAAAERGESRRGWAAR